VSDTLVFIPTATVQYQYSVLENNAVEYQPKQQ